MVLWGETLITRVLSEREAELHPTILSRSGDDGCSEHRCVILTLNGSGAGRRKGSDGQSGEEAAYDHEGTRTSFRCNCQGERRTGAPVREDRCGCCEKLEKEKLDVGVMLTADAMRGHKYASSRKGDKGDRRM